jgi:G3E family GTPase
MSTLDNYPESVKQAAMADRIVLTKTDLLAHPADASALTELRARLAALNPAATILDAAAGEATAARLFDCGLYDPAGKAPDVKRWLAEEAYAKSDHHHHDRHDVNRHDDRIRAFTLTADAAIPAATFDMFLDLVREMHGPNLLRVKGVVKIAETPETPVVVHGVQHVFHPTAALPNWPDDDRRSRLVFIVRDIEPAVIRNLFHAFLGMPALDQPDRAALFDNPLVPFGNAGR